MNKFKYTKTIEFNNCDGCPFCDFIDDDYSPSHLLCSKTITYIKLFKNSGNEDFRNDEGILDNCPFKKLPHITEHDAQ